MAKHLRQFVSVWLLIVCFGIPTMIAVADEPSGEHVNEARRLIEVTAAESLLGQFLAVIVNAQVPLLKQGNPELSDGDIQVFTDVLQREFQANSAELLDEMAKLYASHFTIAEIRELRSFWSSPVGQKFVASQPMLLQAGASIGEDWARRHLPEIIHMAVEEIKVKRG